MSQRDRAGGGFHDSASASMVKRAMRAASRQLSRRIARGLLGGISAAADDGDNVPVILSEAKNLCSQFSTASLEKVQRCFASAQHDNGKIKSPDALGASGDLSCFSLWRWRGFRFFLAALARFHFNVGR